MGRPNLLLRLAPAFALFAMAEAIAPPVEAAPTRQQCVSAYEETQVSMRRSRLLAARASLQTCLDEACPSVLRGDCAGWLKEVEARTSSVVIEVVADGAPVREAKLYVDNALHEAGLDGKAMELDPGAHTFRVEPATGAPASAEALLREGEKLKVVRIELPSSGPKPKNPDTVVVPPPPSQDAPQGPARRPVPWSVFLAGGLTVAAGAAFGTFAILGNSGKSDLEPCKPGCTDDRISEVRQKYIIADVFLGVTVVALAVTGYLYFSRPVVSAALSRPGAIVF